MKLSVAFKVCVLVYNTSWLLIFINNHNAKNALDELCMCMRVCACMCACACILVFFCVRYKEKFQAFRGANYYDFGVTKLSYYDLSNKYQINHFNISHKCMQHMHLK